MSRRSFSTSLSQPSSACRSPYGAGARPSADEALQRALAAFGRGEWDVAMRMCRLVLDARGGDFDALNLLGIIAAQTGRGQEAIALLTRAVETNPGEAAAHNNLGNLLHGMGRPADALACCERAIALAPDYAEAHGNRGNALRDLWRHAEALASYDRAVRLDAGFANAHMNRGILLTDMGRHAEALESLARAIAITPDDAAAHHARGIALADLKRHLEAVDSFERALQLDPERELLEGTWLHTKMQACDWRGIEAHVVRLRESIERGKMAAHPFAVLALPGATPATQRCAAQSWAQRKHPTVPAMPEIARHGGRDRIRLAYVSADFRNHAVAQAMAELFERHDRTRFELVAISLREAVDDPMRGRVAAAFDQFIDVSGRSDTEVAALARERGIDIAIDLGGYTEGARTEIFALRAAPVQASFTGYPGTLGSACFDYLIADPTVVPESHWPHYAEKIVWLPHSYLAYDSTRSISPTTPSRDALGLPPAAFVFCCFNNSFKIMPATFDIWMRLLHRIDGSVLWLSQVPEAAAANLRMEAAARGIGAERLVFAGRLPVAEHLARHRLADLFLDTLPYNAHSTASDALWAGLPVLTCLGGTFAGRVAASLLGTIGLPELVATTPEQYETVAIELATQPARLKAIREKLARNRLATPLFDTALLARHLEAAYSAMHARSQSQLPPEHIRVSP